MPGGGVSGWPWSRLVLSRFGNLYARLILGAPYRDLTGGFKCFRREALETLTLVFSTGACEGVDFPWHQVRAHHGQAALTTGKQGGRANAP